MKKAVILLGIVSAFFAVSLRIASAACTPVSSTYPGSLDTFVANDCIPSSWANSLESTIGTTTATTSLVQRIAALASTTSGGVGPSTSTYIGVFNSSGTLLGYAQFAYTSSTETLSMPLGTIAFGSQGTLQDNANDNLYFNDSGASLSASTGSLTLYGAHGGSFAISNSFGTGDDDIIFQPAYSSGTVISDPSSSANLSLDTSLLTANRNIQFPDQSGVLALQGSSNNYVASLNGTTGTYKLYISGTGLSIATGTASTTITWTNPGYITTSSISINGISGNVFTGLSTDTVNIATATASGVFNVTSSGNKSFTITLPSNIGFFTNDSGFITSSALSGYSTSTIAITTSTAAGVFNVTSSGNKTFNITMPPAHDSFYAPSNYVSTVNGATGSVNAVNTLNGSTGTYNLYVAGTGLTLATGTASTTITWTNPGYITTSTNNFGGLTNASITANSPIGWSNTSTIYFIGPLSIANGGTNATTAAAALSNLGGISTSAIPLFNGSAGSYNLYAGGILSIATGTASTTISLSTSTLNTQVSALGYVTSTSGGSGLASTTPFTAGNLAIVSSSGAIATFGGSGPCNANQFVTQLSASGTILCGSPIVFQQPSITVGASGANYTTLQAAINAANNTSTYPNGVSIQVSQGTYTVTSTQYLSNNYIHIYGTFPETSIQFAAPTSGAALFAASSGFQIAGFEVEDLNIVQNSSTAYTGTAFAAGNISLGLYNDIETSNFANSITLNDTQNYTFYNRFSNLKLFDNNCIIASSTNAVNFNMFDNVRCAMNSQKQTSTQVYGVYINNGQDNNFYQMDLEPATSTKTVGIDLTTTTAIANSFYSLYSEQNATSVWIQGGAKYNNFIGGQIYDTTGTPISDGGTGTSIQNLYNLFTNTSTNEFGIPFTDTDFTGNSLSTVFQNNTNYAHVNSSLVTMQLLNGSDSSNVLKIVNNGTGNSIVATNGSLNKFAVSNGTTTISTTSTFVTGTFSVGTTTPSGQLNIVGTGTTTYPMTIDTVGNVFFGSATDTTQAGGVSSSMSFVNPVTFARDSYVDFVNRADGKGEYFLIQASSSYENIRIEQGAYASQWDLGNFGSTDFGIMDDVSATTPFVIKKTAPTNSLVINASGTVQIGKHLGFATSSVTVSTCGGSSSTISGSDNAGLIKLASSTATCTLNFATAWVSSPVCNAELASGTANASATFLMQVGTGNATITAASALATSSWISYMCQGNPN